MREGPQTATPAEVVLLEFADEVDRFLAHCAASGRPPAAYLVVALWPEVQVALKRRGVAYINTLAFLNNESHKRVVLTSERWLEAVEKRTPLVDMDGLSETYSRELAFHLRFYMTYFLSVIEILDGVCRTWRVATLAACAPNASASRAGAGSPKINRSDRWLGSIVRDYAAVRGLGFVSLPGPPALPRRPTLKQLWVLLDRLMASPCAWLQRYQLRRVKSRPTIVVTSLAYNVTRLVARVKRRFPEAAVILLETGSAVPQRSIGRLRRGRPVDAVMSAVEGLNPGDSRLEEGLARFTRLLAGEWTSAFVSSGVSFPAIVGDKIRMDLIPWIREIRSASVGLRSALLALRPRLVMSPFAVGPVAAIGEICRQSGIPGLAVPHGMLTPPRTKADAIESYRVGTGFVLTTYEYTALQSPWSERYVDAFADRPLPSVIKTGSLILSSRRPAFQAETRQRLFGAGGAAAKVIVYATTLKWRSGIRLQIYETLDEHLAGIADLVSVVRDSPELCLLVKLHPAATLSEGQVRELVDGIDHERIAVSVTMPFEEALSAADLLVSYSSTCIEEAIQSGVPVLLYDRWARYQHLPSVSLNDGPPPGPAPVYYVSDAGRLKAAVQWITGGQVQGEVPASELALHVYPPEVSSNFERFVQQCVDRVSVHQPHETAPSAATLQ